MRTKKNPPVLLIAGLAMILLALCLVFLPEKEEPAPQEPNTAESLAQQEAPEDPDASSRLEDPPEEESPAAQEEEPPAAQEEEPSDPSGLPAVDPDEQEPVDGETDAEKPDAEEPDGEEPEREPEEEAEDAVPELLVQLMDGAGRSLEDLGNGQLIVVRASGNEAAVYAFSKDESGLWQQNFDKIQGHTGRNGVTSNKAEGDKATPTGLYSLTQAFGVEVDPGSLLPYRQVTQESYWVDDSDSAYYNQWVEGTADKDWHSAEHLADYAEQYAYAVVVDYNTDSPVAGKGSAIFLHCGSRATAGCISVPRGDMLELLLWLDPGKDPAILIF